MAEGGVARARDATGLQLDGNANAAVSEILVRTSHELFPEKHAAWDGDD